MRLKRLILVFAAILMVLLYVGAGAEVNYEVIEPAGFAGSALKYPVVYVMPENGYDNSKANTMAVKLQEAMRSGDGIGMLLVMPSFDSDDNLREEMVWLVNEIDNVVYANKTIAEPGFRAVVGADVGGYMAYATMLNAGGAVAEIPELFGFVASVRGHFTEEGNPWQAKYGSMYDKLSAAGKNTTANYFTYMDTPVDDPLADVDKSTNDMGYMFMKFLTGADKHEYTARPGQYNDEFVAESGKRIADRFTKFMMGGTMSQNSSVSSVLVTSEDKTATVNYSVMAVGTGYGATGVFHKFAPPFSVKTDATVRIAVIDPDDPEKELTYKTVGGKIGTWGTIAGTAELENVTNGRTCPIRVTITVLGATFEAATSNMVCIEDSVFEGEKQKVDLMGDWYFNYTGTGDGSQLNAADITKAEYETWSKVTPALDWWKDNFGNVGSAYAQGNAYYAREFELPAQFTTQNPMISVGYVDDRCEVFINGKRVGGTGFKADSSLDPDAKDTWSVYSCFEVDPSVLNYGGKNTIVIRVWNNTGASSGGGGWYAGPIQIGSEAAFAGAGGYTDRFYEETYYSDSIGKDMEYLIYLPKNYDKTDRYYPTMYLLHQFSSNHTSYMVDGVNKLLDEAIEDGLLDEMIVVVPNSDPNSWWAGKWENMVVEDLIPYIDENYRTVKDARYRFTAGCSMGGQGAASVALTNPDLFSGFASFYGAYYGHFGGYFFSFGDSMGDVSPITVAKNDGAEYMENFSTAFICGNQDSYQFGTGKIELHQLLKDYGIDHYFLIDNGGHDGDFYLPRFKDTISFVWKHMYDETELKEQEPDLRKMVNASLEKTENGLTLAVAPNEKLAKYFNELPASKSGYVKEQNPALSVPLRITVTQGGQKFRALLRDFVIEPGDEMIFIYNLTADDFAALVGGNAAFDPEKKFTYTIEGAIFDNNWVSLSRVGEVVLPDTGDNSSLLLWVLALAGSAALLMISKKRAAA